MGGLGFNFQPWFPIKTMLQKEGFLLFDSFINNSSLQGWKQAELTFEH
jgi:hypothetical protein